MGGFSAWHWLVVAVIVILLFSHGRISALFGDLGRGIRNFRIGISDEKDDDQ